MAWAFYNTTGTLKQGSSVLGTDLPIGTIFPYAGTTVPNGWLSCNGGATSRTAFSDLFGAIGTSYGAGDGTTTFNVPDLRGRHPIGSGTGLGAGTSGTGTPTGTALTVRTVGQWGGEESHILSVTEMPAHNHAWSGVNDGTTITGVAGDYPFRIYQDIAANWTGSQGYMGNTGGNATHNTMHPYLVTQYIIKATQQTSVNLNVKLDALTDVSASAPATSDVLRFDGTNWTNTIDPLQTWRLVNQVSCIPLAGLATGTYFPLDNDEAVILSGSGGAQGAPLWRYSSSHFPAIAGKTLQFRVVVTGMTTGTQTVNINAGLHTLATLSGTTSMVITSGGAVTGSTTGAFVPTTGVGGFEGISAAFNSTAMTDGAMFLLGFVTSVATVATGTVVSLTLRLESRYV